MHVVKIYSGHYCQNKPKYTQTNICKRRIKLKPGFSMHVVKIYSGHCCQNKTKKHANKYTGEIYSLQINTVEQRISKTRKQIYRRNI